MARGGLPAVTVLLTVCLQATAIAQLWRDSRIAVEPNTEAYLSSSAARALCAPTPYLAHTVYCVQEASARVVRYARSANQGTSWLSQTVSYASEDAMYAALDVPRDGSDEPHIVWVALADGERGAVVYRHPSGTAEVLTAPGVVTATRPAVAVDQTGTVVVACWYNRDVQDQSLRYRRSIDGGVS